MVQSIFPFAGSTAVRQCALMFGRVFLFFLIHFLSLSSQIDPFTGHLSLPQFLFSLCSNASTSNSLAFVLVERSQGRDPGPRPYFQAISCPFLSYHNLSQSQLSTLLESNVKFEGNQILLLFDEHHQPTTETSLTSLLLINDQLYWQCTRCLPVMLLLQASVDHMVNWSRRIVGRLKTNFRAILISDELPTLHVNPVLGGCRRQAGIFVARNQTHFDQLRRRPLPGSAISSRFV